MRTSSLGVNAAVAAIALAACTGGSPNTPSAAPAMPADAPAMPEPPPAHQRPPTWDVERGGVPKFITHSYIDLTLIREISRFRSGEGHSYADDFEACRSQKHYFRTPTSSVARTIPIFSPVTGVVARTIVEWAGVQIHITPDDYPAFHVALFHVNPTVGTADGTRYEAGARIGTHIGNQTMSDVAVLVDAPNGYRLVSWFDAITDALFETYRARGLEARSDAIITRAARDASPLRCNGEAFADQGVLPNWIRLR